MVVTDHMLIKNHRKSTTYCIRSDTEEEAEKLGLEIDHDDSHCFGDKPFALLVHGTQEAGSDASKAISKQKRKEVTGYNNNTK